MKHCKPHFTRFQRTVSPNGEIMPERARYAEYERRKQALPVELNHHEYTNACRRIALELGL